MAEISPFTFPQVIFFILVLFIKNPQTYFHLTLNLASLFYRQNRHFPSSKIASNVKERYCLVNRVSSVCHSTKVGTSTECSLVLYGSEMWIHRTPMETITQGVILLDQAFYCTCAVLHLCLIKDSINQNSTGVRLHLFWLHLFPHGIINGKIVEIQLWIVIVLPCKGRTQ